jgi:hypothetical protein
MTVYGELPRGVRLRPEQAAYRRKMVVLLLERGCTPPQIAAAMRPVVHEGTIRRDARIAGIRWVKRIKPIALDPAPIDWLHPPVEREGPSDRPALAVSRFLAEMEAARWEPAHAHNLLDARLHGDQDWEKEWLGLIGQLRQIADGLGLLHDDSGVLRATALGRVPPSQSGEALKRVDEGGHGVRGVMKAVVDVVGEARGSSRLGGDIEHDEQHDRPADNLPKHPSSVTLHWPARDGVRV